MARLADDTINSPAAVIEASPDAIVAVDLDGRIRSWNAAAERITGFPAAEVVGRDLVSTIPEEDRDTARDMLARVRAGETIEGRRVTRVRTDGSKIIGLLTLAPIHTDNGEICGSVGILRDITREEAVERLSRRNERLASIGALVAGFAHEINNPIGGILMAAQYARGSLGRLEENAIVAKALDDIEADAKQCAEITRRLLRFASKERGARSECDVNDVIESALGVSMRNVDSTAKTRFHRDDALPRVSICRPEIEQALVNLISNALEARCTEVHVATSVDKPTNSLRITIKDDGAGVPIDVLDHLFDHPFFTTKRGTGATGLGLSLAHALVGDHGGALDVTSSPEQGTLVALQLPLPPGETK